MPDFDDFIAFKMTSESKSSPGCLGSVGIWVLVIVGILSLAGRLVG